MHEIPKEIILDRDANFTGNFWRSLFSGLEIQLKFSTAYQPQTERVNQIVEDMLRMYVMNNPTKWEDYLHLA